MKRAGSVFIALSAALTCCWTMAGSPASAGAAGTAVTAKDRTTAAKINLTGKDLPGWQQSPNQESSNDKAVTQDLAICVGAPQPSAVDIVDVNSPYFDEGNAEVTSGVTIVRTLSDGTVDYNSMRSAKLVPCINKIFVPNLKSALPKGTTITKFSVVAYHPAWMPAPSFGYRVDLGLSVAKKGGAKATASLTSDGFGILSGRAELSLTVTQTDGLPNASLEQRLTKVLVGRARQQSSAIS